MKSLKWTIEEIFFIIMIICLLSLFINDYFITEMSFNEHVHGIILSKKKGSKGSITLFVKKNMKTEDSIKYSFQGKGNRIFF